jgi:hypothetical protein
MMAGAQLVHHTYQPLGVSTLSLTFDFEFAQLIDPFTYFDNQDMAQLYEEEMVKIQAEIEMIKQSRNRQKAQTNPTD